MTQPDTAAVRLPEFLCDDCSEGDHRACLREGGWMSPGHERALLLPPDGARAGPTEASMTEPATAAQREGQTMTHYPVEVLAEDDDDGTMVESKAALEQAVVGHRIVSVEKGSQREGYHGLFGGDSVTVLTLDNGQQVRLVGEGDCCAYTDVEKFLLHPERVDHIITGVGTTDGYTTWHIYADMGDVLELTVNWSCGNPFYYAYGFTIQVEPVSDGT